MVAQLLSMNIVTNYYIHTYIHSDEIIIRICFFLQPIKMMRYRGEDDDVVGFGHFSEVRRVKSGPADVIVPIKARKYSSSLLKVGIVFKRINGSSRGAYKPGGDSDSCSDSSGSSSGSGGGIVVFILVASSYTYSRNKTSITTTTSSSSSSSSNFGT